MNVVSRQTLIKFWNAHPAAQAPLTAWFNAARAATWTTPQDIRDSFGSADFVSDNRVIFDIGGNKYRLVVRIAYRHKQVLIKFVGTHRQYDDIDPSTI